MDPNDTYQNTSHKPDLEYGILISINDVNGHPFIILDDHEHMVLSPSQKKSFGTHNWVERITSQTLTKSHDRPSSGSCIKGGESQKRRNPKKIASRSQSLPSLEKEDVDKYHPRGRSIPRKCDYPNSINKESIAPVSGLIGYFEKEAPVIDPLGERSLSQKHDGTGSLGRYFVLTSTLSKNAIGKDGITHNRKIRKGNKDAPRTELTEAVSKLTPSVSYHESINKVKDTCQKGEISRNVHSMCKPKKLVKVHIEKSHLISESKKSIPHLCIAADQEVKKIEETMEILTKKLYVSTYNMDLLQKKVKQAESKYLILKQDSENVLKVHGMCETALQTSETIINDEVLEQKQDCSFATLMQELENVRKCNSEFIQIEKPLPNMEVILHELPEESQKKDAVIRACANNQENLLLKRSEELDKLSASSESLLEQKKTTEIIRNASDEELLHWSKNEEKLSCVRILTHVDQSYMEKLQFTLRNVKMGNACSREATFQAKPNLDHHLHLFRQDFTKLEGENENLKKENCDIPPFQKELELLVSKQNRQICITEKQSNQICSLQDQNNKLKETCSILIKENQMLMRKLDEKNKSVVKIDIRTTKEQDCTEYEKHLERLTADNADLQEELNKQDQLVFHSTKQIKELQGEIAKLQDSVDDKTQKIFSAEDTIYGQKEVIEELSLLHQIAEKTVVVEIGKYIQKMEAQFHEIKSQLGIKSSALDICRSEKKEFENDIGAMMEEMQLTREALQCKTDQKREDEFYLEELDIVLHNIRDKLSKEQQINFQLQKQLSDWKLIKNYASADGNLLDVIGNLTAELKQKERENLRINTELKGSKNEIGKLQTLLQINQSNKISMLEGKIDDLQQKMAMKEAALASKNLANIKGNLQSSNSNDLGDTSIEHRLLQLGIAQNAHFYEKEAKEQAEMRQLLDKKLQQQIEANFKLRQLVKRLQYASHRSDAGMGSLLTSI